MKSYIHMIVCFAGAVACFHYSPQLRQESDRLRKEARQKSDQVLKPRIDPAPRPGILPNREPLFQPDPGKVIAAPENRAVMQKADALEAKARTMATLSDALNYGVGFLGLLAVLEAVSAFRGVALSLKNKVTDGAQHEGSRESVVIAASPEREGQP